MTRPLAAFNATTISVLSFAAVSVAASTGASELHSKVRELFFFAMIETCGYGDPIFCFINIRNSWEFAVHSLGRSHVFVISVDETANIGKIR